MEAGQSVKLGDNITLDVLVTVLADTIVTIDLNGHELLIRGPQDGNDYYSVFYVDEGCDLTIIDSSSSELDNDGNNTGNIIIESNDYILLLNSVISVSYSGKLNLTGVNITCCNAEWNIANYGTLSISNSNFNVTSGYGIINAGTATIDNESQFIASGTDVTAVENGGTMTIANTTFGESEEVGNNTSIASSGTITLKNIIFDESVSSGSSISITGLAKIESGTFRNKISCGTNGIIKIEGGIFYDETAYVDFTNGVYYNGTSSETQPISIETVDAINKIITMGYTGETEDNLSIVTTTNTDTSKTTYAIFYKLHISEADALFGEDMQVGEKEIVTMYLNTQGLYIDSNINVDGSLNIATGKINTVFDETVNDASDMAPEKVKGKIVVNNGATVTLNATLYYKVIKGSANGINYTVNDFINNTVTASNGCSTSQSGNTIIAVPDEQ